jgi:hypothetical protein
MTRQKLDLQNDYFFVLPFLALQAYDQLQPETQDILEFKASTSMRARRDLDKNSFESKIMLLSLLSEGLQIPFRFFVTPS